MNSNYMAPDVDVVGQVDVQPFLPTQLDPLGVSAIG